MLFWVALAMSAMCAAVALALRPYAAGHSRERAAHALSRHAGRQHIWLSWIISCFFVSLAGALFALMNNFVDPRALRWDQSGIFVIMAVLGGMRSFWGPLIGAAIFVVLQDYISGQTDDLEIVHRAVLRAGRAVFPRGVLGILRRRASP